MKTKFKNNSLYINNIYFLRVIDFVTIIRRVDEGIISYSTGKKLLGWVIDSGKTPDTIIKEKNLGQISDIRILHILAEKILSEYPKQVAEIQQGKKNLIGFLIGQAMKRSNNKCNPQKIRKIFRQLLFCKKGDT